MRVAIIDYGSGNLRSVQQAFERAAHDHAIKAEIILTDKAEDLAQADRIVLPGVGAFGDCKQGLQDLSGMITALNEEVIAGGKPFLGICVGMQLLARRGLEKGETAGLDWIGGNVVPIKPKSNDYKIPQIGWNTLSVHNNHPLLSQIPTGSDGLHAYFVHSYHFECEKPQELIATTDYGSPITAMIGRDNIVGTQFHPEKSQRLGLQLIANFLEWMP